MRHWSFRYRSVPGSPASAEVHLRPLSLQKIHGLNCKGSLSHWNAFLHQVLHDTPRLLQRVWILGMLLHETQPASGLTTGEHLALGLVCGAFRTTPTGRQIWDFLRLDKASKMLSIATGNRGKLGVCSHGHCTEKGCIHAIFGSQVTYAVFAIKLQRGRLWNCLFQGSIYTIYPPYGLSLMLSNTQ